MLQEKELCKRRSKFVQNRRDKIDPPHITFHSFFSPLLSVSNAFFLLSFSLYDSPFMFMTVSGAVSCPELQKPSLNPVFHEDLTFCVPILQLHLIMLKIKILYHTHGECSSWSTGEISKLVIPRIKDFHRYDR